MKPAKYQVISSKKKINFNDIINNKRFNSKNNKRNEVYQLSKSTNINPLKNNQLKQYVDMTVTHFSIKCSLLCNEIEEMKREFITQLQGIVEGFQINDSFFPTVKGGGISKNLNFNKINMDNALNYIEQNKNLNYNIYNNNTKEKINLNNNEGIDLVYERFKKIQNSGSNIEYNYNNNLSNEQNNNNINTIILNKNKTVKNVSKSVHKIKIISNKEKALKILMKSKILTIEDKLKIKNLNHYLFNEFKTKNLISSCKKDYEKALKNLTSQNKDLPTLTSTSILSFLTKDKENELKDESKEINKKFFNLLYLLSEKSNDENSSLENQYDNFCKELKINSIKEFFINYLKNIKNKINDVNDNVIQKVIFYLENNNELIEQTNNESQLISLFSISVNEINEIFKYEKEKRKKIKIYQNLLFYIKKFEKK